MVASSTKIARREIESIDLVRMRDLLAELLSAGEREPLLDTVLALLSKCKEVIEEQAFEIAELERQLFGRKSEKCSPGQMSLFAQLLDAVVQGAAPAPENPSTLARPAETSPAASTGEGEEKPKKKKKRRQPQPTSRQVIPVPEAERPCPTCGGDRHCMGHSRSIVSARNWRVVDATAKSRP